MKHPFLTILFVLMVSITYITVAQTASVQKLSEQMNVLSAMENIALNERSQLDRDLYEPNTVVFYLPESDSWISMPRAKAVELADRLIVIAEVNPAIINKLKKRLGFGWFLVEQALETPGMAADSFVSLIEARQRPQLEAVLADYDSLLDQVREEFFSLQAQRDALLNPTTETNTCTVESWIGSWSTTYNEMNLSASSQGVSGTYNTSNHSISGTVELCANECYLRGIWNHSNSDRTGTFIFRLDSATSFSGAWGESEALTYGNYLSEGISWTGDK